MRKYIPEWAKIIPSQAELKFCGELFDVYQWPQEMFDGSVETFEMLKHADTVIVIGVKDDKIVITHQTQPCEDWFYGFPGGRHDHKNEDELAAAKREMREETGMEFANWKLVDCRQPLSKIEWLVYTFVATDFIKQGPQKLDVGEKIEVLEVTLDELREYAKVPNARPLIPEFLRAARSVGDVKNLPELYHYGGENE